MRNVLPVAVADDWDAEAWAVAQVRSSRAPALVAHYDGTLIANNALAEPLLESGGVTTALRALIADASAHERLQAVRLSLRADTAHATRFDVTLMPLPYRNVLVVGRDATVETNLTDALVASRMLFRDLALCATDFAFETDAEGGFTWVSPNGTLGYSAVELHGAKCGAIFGNGSYFAARAPMRATAFWCEAKGGGERCVELTTVPVQSAEGGWNGVRGVMRDVTALRQHEREAGRARRRDELVNAVLIAMRAQIEPRRMMLAAADALLGATGSHRVAIKPTCAELAVSVGPAAACVERGLVAATTYQNRTNGSVSLSRDAGEYGEDEQHLLDAVTPHLGVAIALAESLLVRGATERADRATGLLGKDAFKREAEARLGGFARAGRSCAALVVACEGVARHWKGEDLLRAIGRVLSRDQNEGDVVGRCAPEQLVVLTAANSGEDAVARADVISSSLTSLVEELGLAFDVRLSLGVAFVEAEAGEPLDEVVARAEQARLAAQRDGGQVAVAESLKKVVSC